LKLNHMALAATILGLGLAPAAWANQHEHAAKDAAHATHDAAHGAKDAAHADPMEHALEAFHDVLHPLFHDALPKKDVKAIKAAIPGLQKHAAEVAACKMTDKACIKACGDLVTSVKDLEAAAKKGDKELMAALDHVHGAFEAIVKTTHLDGHEGHAEHHGADGAHDGHHDKH